MVIALSSVCLSFFLPCVRSQKLSEIGAKFHHIYKKSELLSKNMTSEFVPEIAKYLKSSPFWGCVSLLFPSISDAACFIQISEEMAV